jgi:hypothetical protein
LPVYYFLVAPTIADTESDLMARLVAAAYPILDLALLAGAFSLGFRRMERRQLAPLGLLFIAFTLAFIGDVVYTYG